MKTLFLFLQYFSLLINFWKLYLLMAEQRLSTGLWNTHKNTEFKRKRLESELKYKYLLISLL